MSKRFPTNTTQHKGATQFGVDIVWTAEVAAEKAKDDNFDLTESALHTKRLQTLLAGLQFSPIDEPDKLETYESCKGLADKIRRCTKTEEIEDACNAGDAQRDFVAQLKESINSAQKALKKLTDKYVNLQAKVVSDAQRKKQDDTNLELSLRASELRKQVGQKRSISVFNLAWVDLGHIAMRFVNGDKEFADAVAAGNLFDTPWTLTQSELLKKSLADKGTSEGSLSLMQWLGKWEGSFTNEKTFKAKDRIQAPLETKHTPDLLKPFINQVLPRTAVVDPSAHPRLATVCDKPWFFGYSSTMVIYDFEPDCLGTIRIYTSGKLKVLTWAPSESISDARHIIFIFLRPSVCSIAPPSKMMRNTLRPQILESPDLGGQ